MKFSLKSAGIAALASALALGAASAEDGPIDLHPAKSVKTAPKPSTKTTPSDPATPITSADAIKRANAYLDGAQVMTADFVQLSPDGKRSEGKLYVQRPGHMRFQFAPPDRLDIVADGRSVAVRDQKLGTQDLYLIGQTPLKFLLADHIDIAHDTKVTGVTIDPNAVAITIEDKATFGGSATITLVFDPSTFALKQWIVLDSQGLQTVVTLFNIDLTATPDPALFTIDERQRMMNSNVR
jgi:outer membrane lipoprotein-sorting protein